MGSDFNAELGPGIGTERKSVGMVHTQRGKQKRWLVEKLADAKRLLRPQHDIQKDTSETDDLHISEGQWKTK